ncbi:MAG: winged helix-turn-helix domain-containing protein [Pantoea sp.]|nr:winged helix-turn-helix domain-containing protein [Pantoea sp.]
MNKYVFGDFTLCPRNGLYYKESQSVHLGPKELKVLEALVSRPGEIVTKSDIIEMVWSRGIVSDESLCRCIYVIRKELKNHSSIKFIRTVYGRGYQFISTVAVVKPEREKNFSVCATNFTPHSCVSVGIDNISYKFKYVESSMEQD